MGDMAMRVLQVVRPAAGGIRRHVQILARGLAAQGLTVEVACPDPAQLWAGAEPEGPLPWPAAVAGPGGAAPAIAPRPLPMGARWSPQDLLAALRLARWLRHNRYDLVHAHGWKAAAVAAAALAAQPAPRPPLVVTLHNSLPPAAPGLAGRSLDGLCRWLLAQPAHVIAVSRQQVAEVARRTLAPAQRLSWIPNGIPTAPFDAPLQAPAPLRAELRLPPEVPLAVAACRLVAGKGLDILFTALAQPGVPWHLVLCGQGPARPQLESLARQLGVADRIHFLGFRTDMPAILRQADLFVLPTWSEGLPLAVLEAMAARLPVVATDVGGIPDAVVHDETGWLVPPGQPGPLAAALIALAGQPERRRRLGEAGRRRLEEHFTSERMLAATLAVYQRAVGSSRA